MKRTNSKSTRPGQVLLNMERLHTSRAQSRAPRITTDSLFEPLKADWYDSVTFNDLPALVRPIVEYIHELKPDVVIAGDRGGRFVGLSVFHSWKHRYPGHPFPTIDRKLYFARISSRTAEGKYVEKALHFTLDKAGLKNGRKHSPNAGRVTAPKVLYLDDWAVHGDTARRFIDGARSYGLPKSSLHYATMCGPRIVKDIPHISGDLDRNPRTAVWNDDGHLSGVEFNTWDGPGSVMPVSLASERAFRARQGLLGIPSPDKDTLRIPGIIDLYYERFQATLNLGKIAVCACAEANTK